MAHRLEPIRANLHASFSAAAAPALVIQSGDVVSFATPDVGWGLAPPTSTTAPRQKVEPRDPVKDNGPCLCGPVAVKGAAPGDVLEIAIESVRPAPWGWTYAGAGMATPAHNAALGIDDAPLTLVRWTIDEARRFATNQFGHRVPVRPFPGMIGLAPDPTRDDGNGWRPRACGGNMDCRELIAGTVLYLPVEVEGAMLSVGDGHAAQGDGELSGTAIECAMEEVRLRVTVRQGIRLSGPRARTKEGWVTMGFAPTLDEAASRASSSMLDVMEQELRIARAQALAVASAAVHLRVTQMVNPLRGVHAVWAV